MKKNRITVAKAENRIHFYLSADQSTLYLFSQKYTKGVYEYFRCGRSENELRRFRRWGLNPRLDHTIAKCLHPTYRRCASEESSVA